eukprot:TRINITY_DN19623_c0_g4_i1.p1 TRINITY_DN19623_c0_g4~~TRINITY_DN19623_c0_g4_i1.p1  ORF type:complete len:339 (+),score=72.13 TRINITY_DN19623_c0_g4_i1:176-1192(+)
MGAVESRMSDVLQKFLMPDAGSYTRDWTGFRAPEPDSLLRIDAVRVRVRDSAAADTSAQFLVTGLGAAAGKCTGEPLQVGPSQLVFEADASQADTSEATAWPGQIYVWVHDLQRAWAACLELEMSLGRKIVQQAVCCADERRADALVLQDPGSDSIFVVNQAPKGYSKHLVDAGLFTENENLVSLVDVMIRVPRGALEELQRFYSLQLSAAATRTKDGFRVHFADGALLRQSLTFCEDEASNAEDLKNHKLTIYLPSVAKFILALAKCVKAGLLTVNQADAINAGEFTIKHLQVPAGAGEEATPLEFEHVIRSPVHPSYAAIGGAVAQESGVTPVALN